MQMCTLSPSPLSLTLQVLTPLDTEKWPVEAAGHVGRACLATEESLPLHLWNPPRLWELDSRTISGGTLPARPIALAFPAARTWLTSVVSGKSPFAPFSVAVSLPNRKSSAQMPLPSLPSDRCHTSLQTSHSGSSGMWGRP